MAQSWDVQRRREDFFNTTFDEFVETIIDLEAKVEELTSDRDDLADKLEAAQREA